TVIRSCCCGSGSASPLRRTRPARSSAPGRAAFDSVLSDGPRIRASLSGHVARPGTRRRMSCVNLTDIGPLLQPLKFSIPCKDDRGTMPFAYDAPLAPAQTGLGPAGPFPRARLTHVLDRRWLHYAFLARDGRYSLVANAAWLGPAAADDDRERFTTILLLHERGRWLWSSSQFNAHINVPAWSTFRLPHPHGETGKLAVAARAGAPAVELDLTRTSRPCTSQCAFFGGRHHLRWQSET